MTRGARILIVLFVGLLAGVLWLAAQAFGAAQERQVTYRYISEALSALPEKTDLVSWDAPQRPLDRPFNEADAALIGRALSEAWQQLSLAQETGAAHILRSRWAGPALERAQVSTSDAVLHGGRIAVLSQRAAPVFYHKDGSVFQAEVEMLVARFVEGLDGPEGYVLARETGVATLMNQSNGWRVFTYERRTAAPLKVSAAPWSGSIRGLNYYPGNAPWYDFWPGFDEAQVEQDFRRIADMGANAVRAFLPVDDFLRREGHERALSDLETLLALAETTGLRVIPTLFDLRGGYETGNWALDAVYLDRVVPVLAASPAVAFVDLKNEPDLDFATHGTASVTAWLRTMRAIVGETAPGLPVTIGWSSEVHALRLSDDVDVISYHDYAPLASTRDRFDAVKRGAGSKPVVVSEVGASSYEAAMGYPGSETAQAKELAERLASLDGADGVLVWTLHDFTKVDSRVFGASPWVRRLQTSFGLLRADGSEKPAHAAVREAFGAGSE